MEVNKMKSWKTKSGNTIFQIMSGRSNVFLLKDGNKTCLIDTSTNNDWEQLDKTLESLGIQKIDYLVLTHAHHDHAANARKIKEKYSAAVIIHQNDALHLINGDAVLPQGTNVFTRTLVNLVGKRVESRFDFEPCSYDIQVGSIYDMKNLGFNAYLLHTPGHSTGSMSLIVDDDIAIVGDAMFGVFGKSVFPPYADNPKELIDSWEKLLATNCRLFLPGHGTPKNDNQLRKCFVNKSPKNRLKM
jgi:glyoxylase-like metal-dependent hydrolase (beta-lactamase superfamily II)